MKRNFIQAIHNFHPANKMLFLAGPRQVGKTTLALTELENHADSGIYLNWDVPRNRKAILDHEIMQQDILGNLRQINKRPLVILDEIHKMRTFKKWLKGFYDENHHDVNIWVTGSGRLDLYQKGGDSLLGRYFLYHLHPLSIGELTSNTIDSSHPSVLWNCFELREKSSNKLDLGLLEYGGFPEPFIQQTKNFYLRWSRNRRERITHEDIRELTRIIDLDRLDALISLLNPRIGSPLSVQSLREDLQVAFETVTNWLNTLKRTYYIYSLMPYHKKLQRALQKEEKYYYWDWAEVADEGAKFENYIVSHFAKAVNFWNDFGVGNFKLWYLRDKDKNEVDILVTEGEEVFLLAEVKLSDTALSPTLTKYANKLKCTRNLQIVRQAGIDKIIKTDAGNVHIVSAEIFLQYLP